ncbi:hypothetical protein KK083_11370 [Fulvivirgaceae bacterium PWU4]|uniref:DUF4062 domain-containing protein n=1 Tax=Chryseosolibacter histidini TaxID=2782349 RepID=A0AAP2GIY6_9BACT|nr:hypothetical protein [Chryseosolibacter histidini]MBT1697479.1 hypothetical protein [Chryseosolibacter histidini]
MGFEIDVLIVFAEKDNEAPKNELGWVSQFKKFLELMLNQVLGEKSKILLKADYDSITAPELDKVGVLVPVLSKEFIQSGKCLDHVETFYKRIESASKTRSRVFKVFKTPLSPGEQPPRLRDLIGYDMYQLDVESGEIREYTDYFSTEAERQYWMKMVDLAYDIYDTLLQLKEETSRAEIKNIYKRKTIYLAETGHDLSVQRNIIKRELQRHGYVVLPNQTLPNNVADLEKVVQRDLTESNLSIHLIGSAYGEIPAGSERSVVDIQNKLAAEKSLRAKESHEDFTRLIWISPTLVNASERQKGFIENIKRDVEAQEGAEILQTPLEDFKNIMREELVESGERKPSEDVGGRSVYLMHDRMDVNDVKPIKEVLEKAGFRVLVPEFEGELLEVRKKHIDNLRTFDAAIIYKGKVNEQWVRMKALDLLKAPGFGRKKPIIGKAILTPPGSTLNAEAFKSQNLRVIESDPQRSVESIKSFIQEFNV